MRITYFLIFLLVKTGASGQSLPELLTLLPQQNPELKALEKEYQSSLQWAAQASQRPDLELGISGFPLPVETRLGPQFLRLSARQGIPWFGSLNAKADLASAQSAPLQERVTNRELELSYLLEKAYYELYEQEQTQRIIQEQIQLLHGQEQIALADVENGRGSMVRVLELQLGIKEKQQELARLKVNKQTPRSVINSLLARPTETPISIIDTLVFTEIPFTAEALLEQVTTNYPMLQYYDLQQNAAQAAIAVNNLDAKPDFGVGLDYIMVSERTHSFLEGNGRDIVQVAVTVRMPLSKESYRAKEQEEYLRIEALELHKQALQDDISAQITSALAAHEDARLQFQLAQEQVQLVRSAQELTQATYSSTGKGFTTILEWEERLWQYELTKLKAIVASHQAKAQLNRLLTVRIP